MFTISATKEEVLEELPFINDWINSAKTIKSNLEESELEFYYSYGFFYLKTDNKEEYYTNMLEKCSQMFFDERLQFELSKVRVNLLIKSGHFFISNRLEKGVIPKIIKDIITEITKVKMLVEYEFNQNESIKSSIPEVNSDIVSFEIIRDVVNKDYVDNLDIDSILDKISNEGLDSLSEEEKDFLDKKSKDV